MWDELDRDIQEALVRWLNRKPTAADKRRLAKLHEDGRFWSWDCILCGDPCVHAHVHEEEWKHFQGAADSIDMTYFGDRDTYTSAALMSMCDHCRGFKCQQIPDDSPAWDLDDQLSLRHHA